MKRMRHRPPFFEILERFRPALLAIGIFVIHISFGLPHIGSFVTADEHYWVEERIPQYWSAWANGKWKKTLINDKPGVSLALVSGPALSLYPEGKLECRTNEGQTAKCDPDITSRLYASFRVPILIANSLLLVAIFFAIRAFAGTAVAFATTMFSAVSPQLVGASQIVNPDSLLWSSGGLALFSVTAYLITLRTRHLMTAILALALALLSKYVALIILLFLPFILFGVHSANPDSTRDERRAPRVFGTLAVTFFPLLLFVLAAPGVISSEKRMTEFLSAGTGHVALPWGAYLVLFIFVLIAMYGRFSSAIICHIHSCFHFFLRAAGSAFLIAVISIIIGRFALPQWNDYLFGQIPFDLKNLSDSKYYTERQLSLADITFMELSPLIYSIPLATLVLALAGIGYRSTKHSRSLSVTIPLIFLLFVVIELAAFAFGNVQAIPRYILLALPTFSFLAADAVVAIARIIRDRVSGPVIRPYVLPAIVLVTICLSATALLRSTPFHANFANLLLPKNDLTAHSWGYGGYEAAEYLNALPNADRLTIWSDYYGVCEFFRGDCLTNYTFDPKMTRPDYYVLTRRGMIRYLPRARDWERKSGLIAHNHYDDEDSAWELNILGKKENFVKIVKP